MDEHDDRMNRFWKRRGRALSQHYLGAFVEDRYHVVQFIAEGGMGMVYIADDTKLPKTSGYAQRAIKFIRPKLVTNDSKSRLLREAGLLSQLVGVAEGLLDIHAFGEHHGQVYLVTEYVPGMGVAANGEPCRNLQQYVESKGGRLPARQAAELVRRCAVTMDLIHRHDAGIEPPIVHRDLKPANILIVADETDQSLHMRTKIADFGLAASVGEHNEVTGTPGYMAPEQCDPLKFGTVTPATDIWALGVILYELITGELPIPLKGDSPQQQFAGLQAAFAQLQNQTQPVKINSLGDADLTEICRRCLQLDPAKRYQPAGVMIPTQVNGPAGATGGPNATVMKPRPASDLTEALERWLSLQPLSEPHGATSWPKRGWLFLRRNAIASVATVLFLVTAVAAFWINSERARADLSAANNLSLANEKDKLAKEKQSEADRANKLAADNSTLAKAKATEADRANRNATEKTKLAAHNAQLAKDKQAEADRAKQHAAAAVMASNDSKFALAQQLEDNGANRVQSLSWITALPYLSKANDVRRELQDQPVGSISQPQLEQLSRSSRLRTELILAATPRLTHFLQTKPTGGRPTAAFVPNSHDILLQNTDTSLWSLDKGTTETLTFKYTLSLPAQFAPFLEKLEKMGAKNEPTDVRADPIDSASQHTPLQPLSGDVYIAQFVDANFTKKFGLFNFRKREMKQIEELELPVLSFSTPDLAAVSPNGERSLLLSGNTPQVTILNNKTGNVKTFQCMAPERAGETVNSPYEPTQAALAPDGKGCLLSINDPTGFGPLVKTAEFRDSDTLCAVYFPNIAKRQEMVPLYGGTASALSPDGRWIALHKGGQAVAVLSAKTQRELFRTTATCNIEHLMFSPNSNYLFALCSEFSGAGTVESWHVGADGEGIAGDRAGLALMAAAPQFLAQSSDGRLVASIHHLGTGGSVLQVWRGFDLAQAAPPLPHAFEITSVQFAPDCRRVLTGSKDGSFRVWDLATPLQCAPIVTVEAKEIPDDEEDLPEGEESLLGSTDELDVVRLPDASCVLLDKATKVRRPINDSKGLDQVTFAEDRRSFVGSFGSNDLRILHVEIGAETLVSRLHTVPSLKGKNSVISSLFISPKGRYFGVGASSNKFYFKTLTKGASNSWRSCHLLNEVKRIQPDTQWATTNGGLFSPDESSVIVRALIPPEKDNVTRECLFCLDSESSEPKLPGFITPGATDVRWSAHGEFLTIVRSQGLTILSAATMKPAWEPWGFLDKLLNASVRELPNSKFLVAQAGRDLLIQELVQNAPRQNPLQIRGDFREVGTTQNGQFVFLFQDQSNLTVYDRVFGRELIHLPAIWDNEVRYNTRRVFYVDGERVQAYSWSETFDVNTSERRVDISLQPKTEPYLSLWARMLGGFDLNQSQQVEVITPSAQSEVWKQLNPALQPAVSRAQIIAWHQIHQNFKPTLKLWGDIADLNDLKSSIPHFVAVAELDNTASNWSEAGRVGVSAGNYGSARRCFERALTLDPNNPELTSWKQLADILDGASDALPDPDPAHPDLWPTLWARGLLAVRNKDLAKAEAWLTQSFDKGGDAWVGSDLAHLRAATGQYAIAERWFTALADFHPKKVSSLIAVAYCQLAQGKDEEYQQTCRKIRDLCRHRQEPAIHKNLGWLLSPLFFNHDDKDGYNAELERTSLLIGDEYVAGDWQPVFQRLNVFMQLQQNNSTKLLPPESLPEFDEQLENTLSPAVPRPWQRRVLVNVLDAKIAQFRASQKAPAVEQPTLK